MRVPFNHLPREVQEQLARIWDQRGAGAGAYFQPKSHRWMGWVGLVCVLACPLAAAIALEVLRDPHVPFKAVVLAPALIALMTGTYGPLALWEWVRLLKARPGRFLLISPTNFVECRGPGRPVVLYRLNQVTRFQKTQTYDSNQKWAGLAYAFTFEDGATPTVTLKAQSEIEVLDAVLAWAAAKGRGEALPDLPGARLPDLCPAGLPPSRPGALEQLADPQSEAWLGGWGFLVLALVLIWILTAVATRH